MSLTDRVNTAIDVASKMQAIQREQEAYAELKNLPALPAHEDLLKELSEILEDPALFGNDKSVADAAALVSEALHGEAPETNDLPYLGQALVLAVQSRRGRTREAEFQSTLRYLLAQNNYTPVAVRSYNDGEEFHFFADKSGEKVVAISRAGSDIYAVELRDKYRLDDLVNDFDNLKRGTSKRLLQVQRELSFDRDAAPDIGIPIGLISCISSFVYTVINFGTEFPPGLVIVPLAAGIISGCVAGGVAVYRTNKRNNRIWPQEKAYFEHHSPHRKIRGGVYAIVDAFPLEQNPPLKLLPGK